MSYDAIHASLQKCKRAANDDQVDLASLIESLEMLVVLLESEFTQLKAAVGHTATLIEKTSRGD
jgi:hypothetical protein